MAIGAWGRGVGSIYGWKKSVVFPHALIEAATVQLIPRCKSYTGTFPFFIESKFRGLISPGKILPSF